MVEVEEKMDRATLCQYGRRDFKVTNKIRQVLTTLFDKDEKTERNLLRLSSRAEFALSPGEKSSVRKSVRDNENWQAADTFILNWVGHKASLATFGVLLEAVKEMEWSTIEDAIVNYKWDEIEGMINQRQEALEQLR